MAWGNPEMWDQAFRQAHGGLSLEEFNYLSALQKQSQQQPPPVANSTQVAQPANSMDVTPFNENYASNLNFLGMARDNSITGIEAQKPALRSSYGYLESGDLDPNNPFGKAQLLQRSYEQSKSGNTNRYASRGQLYSGALQNAQNEAQFANQANQSGLRNAYGQQVAALDAQKAQAQSNYNIGAGQAGNDRVNQLIAARAPGYFNEPTPTPQAAPYQAQPLPNPNSYGPPGSFGDPQNWEQAFKNTHGGLSVAEYNYLQAQYRAGGGR